MMWPPHVWAVAEVRHANQGWPPGLTAWLEYDKRRRQWTWNLQAKSAGIKVDRALKNARFLTIPTALAWAQGVKFMRNVVELREWQDVFLPRVI